MMILVNGWESVRSQETVCRRSARHERIAARKDNIRRARAWARRNHRYLLIMWERYGCRNRHPKKEKQTMTVSQKAALEKYFADLDGARDTITLYCQEDKIRGAMQLLLDTEDMTYNEYEEYDNRLRTKIWQLEDKV